MNNKNEVWKVNYTSFFNSKEIICILIKRQFQELFRDIFVKYARIYLHIQTYNLYVEYNNKYDQVELLKFRDLKIFIIFNKPISDTKRDDSPAIFYL